MNSTRFLKNFCALGLSVFSAVFALSYAFNADSNNQLDASNEAEVTGTGTAYGSSITRPFDVNEMHTFYTDANGYIWGTGHSHGEAGNGSTSINTSFYQMRKNGNATTSPDGTEKAKETGYFTDVIDYAVGDDHSIVIDSDGAVWGAGSCANGRLGTGTLENTSGNVHKVSNITSGASKVAAGGSHTLVVMDDGSIMASGVNDRIGLGDAGNTYSFTETIDRFTTESKRGVVDMACGLVASYVLFGDGDLWYSSSTSGASDDAVGVGTWALMASNIKMFDIDSVGYYIYAVTTSNVIMYAHYLDTTFTQMTSQPTEEVMQIRGAGYISNFTWGYLTTDNNLYLSSTSAYPGNTYNTAATLVEETKGEVVYFDLGNQHTVGSHYGVLTTNGNLTLWGGGTQGQLGDGKSADVTYANRISKDIGLSADDIPNINAGIFNTPPDASPRK